MGGATEGGYWGHREDSDHDLGCNIELNFGRPARPEECLEDDEVLCLLVTKGRGMRWMGAGPQRG